MQNLTNGATSRSPVLTDEVPFNDVGTGGGKTTPQALLNLVGSLTNESSPVAADSLPLYDASASATDRVTLANQFEGGKVAVITYTGNGTSGRTVTLTGINRLHAYVLINTSNTGNIVPHFGAPAGSTGAIFDRAADGQDNNTSLSVDAPSAGSSQTLTIDNTSTAFNGNTNTYAILCVGAPI